MDKIIDEEKLMKSININIKNAWASMKAAENSNNYEYYHGVKSGMIGLKWKIEHGDFGIEDANIKENTDAEKGSLNFDR